VGAVGSKGLEEIAKQTLPAPQDSPRGDFLYHVTNGNGTFKGFLLTFLPLEMWKFDNILLGKCNMSGNKCIFAAGFM
jgi:hypothetical protein